MSELQNPHDHFFRYAFSQVEIARDFLIHYAPAAVVAEFDLATLEVTAESFVDDALHSHHTDLLYRVKLKNGGTAYIYILLEHKSYADEQVGFQLLRYKVRIWERVPCDANGKLPPVFSLVFYHGPTPWRTSQQFADMVAANETLAEYTPHFKYHLCDLSAHSATELQGIALLQLVLFVMQSIFAPDLLTRLDEIAELIRQARNQTALEFFIVVLRYLAAANDKITDDVLRRVVRKSIPAQEEKVMATLASQWAQKGAEQATQEMLQQWTQQLLLALESKFGVLRPAVKQRIYLLPVSQVKQLTATMFNFKKKTDLTKWLDEHQQPNATESSAIN
jgi:predicted transposase/invertase (TIGR01784 family)